MSQTDQKSATTQSVDEDFSAHEETPSNTDDSSPTPTNLQTGKPLSVVLSPFHWGRLSLISATAYQGYDTNPNLLPTSQGSRIAAFSGLVVYSRAFGGSRLDLQYHPFFLASSTRKLEDFGAASAGFITQHQLNRSWQWRLSDFLRYSPRQQATVEGQSFVLNAGGGLTVGNAFLTSGRNFLENALGFAVRDQYGPESYLEFHVDERLGRLSNPAAQAPGDSLVQKEFRTGAGAKWSDALSIRDTLHVRYDYAIQTSSGANVAGVRSHTIGLEWEHRLTPSLKFFAEAGPIWTIVENQQPVTQTRAQGYIQIVKEFSGGAGAVGASFSRSNSFSGVISDSLNSRYDFSVERRVGIRWNLATSFSYVQQQRHGLPGTTGSLGHAQIGYSLSRNWSIFTQGRYVRVVTTAAPEKILTVGVSWAWTNDKP